MGVPFTDTLPDANEQHQNTEGCTTSRRDKKCSLKKEFSIQKVVKTLPASCKVKTVYCESVVLFINRHFSK